MRNNSLKKWLLTGSIGLTSAIGIAIACGGGWDYSIRETTTLTPEYFVDSSLQPFMWDPDSYFYTDMVHSTVSDFDEDIVQDWMKYLGGTLSKKQVEQLLVSDTFNRQLIAKNYNYPFFAKINTKDAKVANFLEFLSVAKPMEVYSTQVMDYWEYEPSKLKRTPIVEIAGLKKKYEDKVATTKDQFLINRYWFQVVKALFYSGNQDQLIAFFKNTEANVPKNNLYYRAMSYLSGAYVKKQKTDSANYYNAIVFNNAPALRKVAVMNFKAQDEAAFQRSLSMLTNTSDKEALWTILGYYADEMRALDNVHKLNPKSKYQDMLLVRYINQLEGMMANDTFKTLEQFKASMSKSVKETDAALVTNIANEPNLPNAILWKTAAGYINTFKRKYNDADKFYAAANSLASKSQLKDQIRLLSIQNKLLSTNKMDEKFGQSILADMKWLDNRVGEYYDMYESDVPQEDLRGFFLRRFSKSYISRLYRDNGDKVMAEVFQSDLDIYKNPKALKDIKSFLSKSNKTEWEKYAVGLYDIKLHDIEYYEGLLALYNGDYNTAIQHLSASDSLQRKKLFGANPFNGFIQDCHDCEFEKAKQPYAKNVIEFVKLLQEMDGNVQAGKDVYNNALLLGNAYYNLSYFGNGRTFYEESKVLNEYGIGISLDRQPMLLGMKNVKKYYDIALKNATNDEQKAKLSYLLAKVERNDFYTNTYFTQEYYWGDAEVAFKAWNGFKDLKDKYAHTQYYKDVIKECTYFQKYLAKRK